MNVASNRNISDDYKVMRMRNERYHKSSLSSNTEILAEVKLAAMLSSALESDSFFLLEGGLEDEW